jgi:hypothetical protein
MKGKILLNLLEVFENVLIRKPWKGFEETTGRTDQHAPYLLGLIDDTNDDNIVDD